MTGRDEVKDLDTVRVDNWRISRETLELAYIWYSERSGKTEIFDNRNSVECI